mgnify:CR=1 FL=1
MPIPHPAAVERHPHLAQPLPSGWVRVDLHSHTMWSGDSTTTPDEVEAAVTEAGLDVLCITDHNAIRGASELVGRLPCRVIVGEELRTHAGEIIGLFLAERVAAGTPPAEAARAIRAQGGIVYVPHPFDPMRRNMSRPALYELANAGLIDAVETLNAKTGLRSLNEQSLELNTCGLGDGDARAGFRNVQFDIRSYKKMRMYVHAESRDPANPIAFGDVSVFIRIGNDSLAPVWAATLATVQSVAAVGGVVGGLLMSAWGGPKQRVRGVLWGMTVESLLGPIVLGVARGLPGWIVGSFMSQAFIPIINGSNQAIWQSKVPPAVQGRVFSTRRMIAQFSFPIAVLLAGPLADRVFEPAMQGGGAAAALFGPLVGTGPGAGMGLMVALSGVFGAAVGLVGYLVPAVRHVETILPDFDSVAPAAAPGAEAATP